MRKALGFTAALLALALCAAGAQAGDDKVAAKVNGATIAQEKVDRTVETMLASQGIDVAAVQDQAQLAELKRRVLEALIVQELLWQEAEDKKLVASDAQVAARVSEAKQKAGSEQDYEKRLEEAGFTAEAFEEDVRRQLSVERLIQEDIAKDLSVSDAEVHAFYEANTDKLTRPAQIHARHILIKVAPDADEAAKQAARERAEAVLEKARKKGADFAALAEEYSEGPSGPRGGDLGFAPRGQFVPAFEAAAWGLEPGEISDVVETRFGYHVLKLEEKRPGEVVPEAEVSDRIRQHLAEQKSQAAVQARVKALREKAEVEIVAPL